VSHESHRPNRRDRGDRDGLTPVSAMIAAMDGARVPGGCDHCDAYQVVEAHWMGESNVHSVGVHHDRWCPWWRAREIRLGRDPDA
jgi:hypothetical protein